MYTYIYHALKIINSEWFQASLTAWTLMMGPICCPKRRQQTTILRCVKCQKSADVRFQQTG